VAQRGGKPDGRGLADGGVEGELTASVLGLSLIEGWSGWGGTNDLAADGADGFRLRVKAGDECFECGHMLERSDEMG
jgi:hypothetical protein